jgi:hypothetical protein
VYDRRLLQAGDDDAGPLMTAQVLGNRTDPFGMCLCKRQTGGLALPDLNAQLLRQSKSEGGDLGRPQRQAMVGHGTSIGVGALDDVQPVHGRLPLPCPPPGGEIMRIANAAGFARQKIGVEGQDDRRLVETRLRLHVFAEGQAGPLPCVAAIHRFVLMPLGRRKLVE